MKVIKYLNTSGAGGHCHSLAPGGSSAVNQVGYLKIRALPASTGTNHVVRIQLLVKPENASATWEADQATAGAPGPSADAAKDGFLLMDATETIAPKELEFGNRFAGGYRSDAHGAPLATHIVYEFPSGITGPDLIIEGQ